MNWLKENWFKIVIVIPAISIMVVYTWLSILNHNKAVWHQVLDRCGKEKLYLLGCIKEEDGFYIGNLVNKIKNYCAGKTSLLTRAKQVVDGKTFDWEPNKDHVCNTFDHL